METQAHLVSVVILNWNGKKHLLKCLTSLKSITYKPVEVIVVDNASSDDSVSAVKKSFPWVKIIANTQNRGYSGGNNDGIKASRGEYIFILNNDTQVHRSFVEPLVEIMKDPSVACVQPKLVYGDKRTMLNAVGSYFTSSGFLYHYGYRKNADLPQYNSRLTIYSAKGAAMMLRKSALDRVGLFDEDFFIYFEETDLCHRLWLAGYTVVYEPTSLIYHYEAVDTHREMENSHIMFLSYRNRIASFIKNLSFESLILLLPTLLFEYIFLSLVYLLQRDWRTSLAMYRALYWNIGMVKAMGAKRVLIQKSRVITDKELFDTIWRDPPLGYYYYLFAGLQHFRHEPSLVEKNRI